MQKLENQEQGLVIDTTCTWIAHFEIKKKFLWIVQNRMCSDNLHKLTHQDYGSLLGTSWKPPYSLTIRIVRNQDNCLMTCKILKVIRMKKRSDVRHLMCNQEYGLIFSTVRRHENPLGIHTMSKAFGRCITNLKIKKLNWWLAQTESSHGPMN